MHNGPGVYLDRNEYQKYPLGDKKRPAPKTVKQIAICEIPSHLAFLRSVRRLLVTASVVPSSRILVTLMKEALRSSETSVLTRVT
jgi:hypothetical protein